MAIKKQGKTTIKKIKKQKEIEVNDFVPYDPDAELVDFVRRNHDAAVDYRKKFKDKWDMIIQQVRCVHPSAWANKESWQSKVFIPQQTKKVETARAYLDKMLFGVKRFFNISGVERRDKDLEGNMMDLFDVVLDRGNYSLKNDIK